MEPFYLEQLDGDVTHPPCGPPTGRAPFHSSQHITRAGQPRPQSVSNIPTTPKGNAPLSAPPPALPSPRPRAACSPSEDVPALSMSCEWNPTVRGPCLCLWLGIMLPGFVPVGTCT